MFNKGDNSYRKKARNNRVEYETKKIAYQSQKEFLFLDQKRKKIAQIRKNISKFGIDPNELGIFTLLKYEIAYNERVKKNNGLGSS